MNPPFREKEYVRGMVNALHSINDLVGTPATAPENVDDKPTDVIPSEPVSSSPSPEVERSSTSNERAPDTSQIETPNPSVSPEKIIELQARVEKTQRLVTGIGIAFAALAALTACLVFIIARFVRRILRDIEATTGQVNAAIRDAANTRQTIDGAILSLTQHVDVLTKDEHSRPTSEHLLPLDQLFGKPDEGLLDPAVTVTLPPPKNTDDGGVYTRLTIVVPPPDPDQYAIEPPNPDPLQVESMNGDLHADNDGLRLDGDGGDSSTAEDMDPKAVSRLTPYHPSENPQTGDNDSHPDGNADRIVNLNEEPSFGRSNHSEAPDHSVVALRETTGGAESEKPSPPPLPLWTRDRSNGTDDRRPS